MTYIFVSPEPYQVPSTSAIALQRFFNLLKTFQWRTKPLIVDPLREINFDNKDVEIIKKLVEWRKSNEGKNLYIVTFRDQVSKWFTLNSPNLEEFRRLQKFARMTLKQFKKLRMTTSRKKILTIFKTPLVSFDSLIQLDPLNLCDYDTNLLKKKSILKLRHEIKKQKMLKTKSKKFLPLCNFNLRMFYITDLRSIFGRIACFYTNNLGGDQIALRWRIKNREKRKEFFLDMLELGKGLVKNATFRL